MLFRLETPLSLEGHQRVSSVMSQHTARIFQTTGNKATSWNKGKECNCLFLFNYWNSSGHLWTLPGPGSLVYLLVSYLCGFILSLSIKTSNLLINFKRFDCVAVTWSTLLKISVNLHSNVATYFPVKTPVLQWTPVAWKGLAPLLQNYGDL